MLVEKRLWKMMEREKYRATHALFIDTALITDKRAVPVRRSDLTWTSVLYSEIVSTNLSTRWDEKWVRSALPGLRLKVLESKNAAKKNCTSHCWPSFFRLKFQVLNTLLDSLQSFASLLRTTAAPLEYFTVTKILLCRTGTRRFYRRVQEILWNVNRALHYSQTTRAGVHGVAAG